MRGPATKKFQREQPRLAVQAQRYRWGKEYGPLVGNKAKEDIAAGKYVVMTPAGLMVVG